MTVGPGLTTRQRVPPRFNDPVALPPGPTIVSCILPSAIRPETDAGIRLQERSKIALSPEMSPVGDTRIDMGTAPQLGFTKLPVPLAPAT